jgi:hypothetical protein
MPTTKAGAKVKKKLESEYGQKKGDSVYFALQVKGKGGKGKKKWEGAGGTGKLAKAKKTYASRHKKVARAASKVMQG